MDFDTHCIESVFWYILNWICTLLQVVMDILIILILLIHEYRLSFHAFQYLLQFLSSMSYSFQWKYRQLLITLSWISWSIKNGITGLPWWSSGWESLVWEDPTCGGATKPMCPHYSACALMPMSHNYWAHATYSPALRREKPSQQKAHTLQSRVQPLLSLTRQSSCTAAKTQGSQK